MISLILLNVAMLVGCYLSGYVPLVFNLSPSKMRYVTIFGAGLLVGTALTVIIPEGIHSMYSISAMKEGSHHSHDRKLFAINNNQNSREVKLDIDNQIRPDNQRVRKLIPVHGNSLESNKNPSKFQRAGGRNDDNVTNQHVYIDESIHKKIGLCLIIGFLFMLLVDNVSALIKRRTGIQDLASSTGNTRRYDKTSATTIGLVIHAAADGIALGAASSMAHFQLEIIVFLAIMLHKAPASFGYVSFLLHENVERVKIRRNLLVFSLAAPVTSFITYITLSDHAKQHMQEANATGIALLFSAGTFLYVATVHVLPELSSSQSHHHAPTTITISQDQSSKIHKSSDSAASPNTPPYIFHSPIITSSGLSSSSQSNGGGNGGTGGFSLFELILIISGSICPIFLSMGHSH